MVWTILREREVEVSCTILTSKCELSISGAHSKSKQLATSLVSMKISGFCLKLEQNLICEAL